MQPHVPPSDAQTSSASGAAKPPLAPAPVVHHIQTPIDEDDMLNRQAMASPPRPASPDPLTPRQGTLHDSCGGPYLPTGMQTGREGTLPPGATATPAQGPCAQSPLSEGDTGSGHIPVVSSPPPPRSVSLSRQDSFASCSTTSGARSYLRHVNPHDGISLRAHENTAGLVMSYANSVATTSPSALSAVSFPSPNATPPLPEVPEGLHERNIAHGETCGEQQQQQQHRPHNASPSWTSFPSYSPFPSSLGSSFMGQDHGQQRSGEPSRPLHDFAASSSTSLASSLSLPSPPLDAGRQPRAFSASPRPASPSSMESAAMMLARARAREERERHHNVNRPRGGASARHRKGTWISGGNIAVPGSAELDNGSSSSSSDDRGHGDTHTVPRNDNREREPECSDSAHMLGRLPRRRGASSGASSSGVSNRQPLDSIHDGNLATAYVAGSRSYSATGSSSRSLSTCSLVNGIRYVQEQVGGPIDLDRNASMERMEEETSRSRSRLEGLSRQFSARSQVFEVEDLCDPTTVVSANRSSYLTEGPSHMGSLAADQSRLRRAASSMTSLASSFSFSQRAYGHEDEKSHLYPPPPDPHGISRFGTPTADSPISPRSLIPKDSTQRKCENESQFFESLALTSQKQGEDATISSTAPVGGWLSPLPLSFDGSPASHKDRQHGEAFAREGDARPGTPQLYSGSSFRRDGAQRTCAEKDTDDHVHATAFEDRPSTPPLSLISAVPEDLVLSASSLLAYRRRRGASPSLARPANLEEEEAELPHSQKDCDGREGQHGGSFLDNTFFHGGETGHRTRRASRCFTTPSTHRSGASTGTSASASTTSPRQLLRHQRAAATVSARKEHSRPVSRQRAGHRSVSPPPSSVSGSAMAGLGIALTVSPIRGRLKQASHRRPLRAAGASSSGSSSATTTSAQRWQRRSRVFEPVARPLDKNEVHPLTLLPDQEADDVTTPQPPDVNNETQDSIEVQDRASSSDNDDEDVYADMNAGLADHNEQGFFGSHDREGSSVSVYEATEDEPQVDARAVLQEHAFLADTADGEALLAQAVAARAAALSDHSQHARDWIAQGETQDRESSDYGLSGTHEQRVSRSPSPLLPTPPAFPVGFPHPQQAAATGNSFTTLHDFHRGTREQARAPTMATTPSPPAACRLSGSGVSSPSPFASTRPTLARRASDAPSPLPAPPPATAEATQERGIDGETTVRSLSQQRLQDREVNQFSHGSFPVTSPAAVRSLVYDTHDTHSQSSPRSGDHAQDVSGYGSCARDVSPPLRDRSMAPGELMR